MLYYMLSSSSVNIPKGWVCLSVVELLCTELLWRYESGKVSRILVGVDIEESVFVKKDGRAELYRTNGRKNKPFILNHPYNNVGHDAEMNR